MKPFVFALILWIECFICPLMAQEPEPSGLLLFRDLHIRCEEAYKHNDYTAMKLSLDERQGHIDNGSMAGMSKEDSVEVLGMFHKDWGSYYSCLAYIDDTGYSKAKKSFEESLEIFGRDALSSSVIRTEMAQIHYRCREYQEALALLEQNFNFYSRQFIEESLVTLSQVALCKARLKRFDEALEDIDKALEICSRQKSGIDGDYELIQELRRKKGKILILRSEEYDSDGEEALAYFKEYFSYAKSSILDAFSRMDADERERYWLRMHPFVVDCYRLEDVDPSFLYDVTLFSKSLLLQFSRQGGRNPVTDYRDIQQRLEKDEAAIEFVRYEAEDEMKYCALLLHSEGAPSFIPIGSETELLQHRIYGRVTVSDALGLNSRNQYRDSLYVCESFSKLIWNKKLRRKLSDIGKVYFSPDGILHQIAVEYMYPYGEDISFHRLTSTKELLESPIDIASDSMLVCGGVNYCTTVDDEDDNDGNDALAYDILRKRRMKFGFLKGSLSEADSVFRLRNMPGDSLITGKNVSESVCSRLMGRYPVVMLATHGYFDGKADDFSEELKPRTSDHTMSESVLLLAGGQRNMDDDTFDSSKRDGILSARELSSMQLNDVELFIVSACQSGLGYMTPDGVYGLQRGLKNAGVRAMIVSLWNVEDEATRYFMINLNRALVTGCDLQSAFEYARDCMDCKVECRRRTFDRKRDCGSFVVTEEAEYARPCYKNAFILIDNI